MTSTRDTGWLPEGFSAPRRFELPTGHHLRQIRAEDSHLDYPTVMDNQPMLWETFGEVWGWPPHDMTPDQNRRDLERHVTEMERHESFNYAIFDGQETTIRGCVYIDPPERSGADADVSWWVVAEERGGPLEQALRTAVPHWLGERWPFETPRIIGVDLTWQQWQQLPER